MKIVILDLISFRTNQSKLIFNNFWYKKYVFNFFGFEENDFSNIWLYIWLSGVWFSKSWGKELQIHRITFKNHCMMWIWWLFNDFQWFPMGFQCLQCIECVYSVYNVYRCGEDGHLGDRNFATEQTRSYHIYIYIYRGRKNWPKSRFYMKFYFFD